MNTFLQGVLAILVLFLIILVVLTLFPFTADPSSNGVARLVDEQYHVLCYYSRFAMSCVTLP